MDVRVDVHLEDVPGENRLAWWADSPDVPGFSALDDDLPSLMVRADIALQDLVERRKGDELILHYCLVSDAAWTDNPALDAAYTSDAEPTKNPGQEGVSITARQMVSA